MGLFDFLKSSSSSSRSNDPLSRLKQELRNCGWANTVDAIICDYRVPASVLSDVVTYGDCSTRSIAARSENIFVDTLVRLADDSEAFVRESVASNPLTPETVVARLSRDSDSVVRSGAARNPMVSTDILTRLAREESGSTRICVASNASTPSNVIERLSKDENVNVRDSVAWNIATPSYILDTLLKDDEDFVRGHAASNPMLSASAISKSIVSDDIAILKGISMNTALTNSQIEMLMANERHRGTIYRGLAGNPATPESALIHLAKWRDGDARGLLRIASMPQNTF